MEYHVVSLMRGIREEGRKGRKTEFMDIESRLVIASEEDEVQWAAGHRGGEAHIFTYKMKS